MLMIAHVFFSQNSRTINVNKTKEKKINGEKLIFVFQLHVSVNFFSSFILIMFSTNTIKTYKIYAPSNTLVLKSDRVMLGRAQIEKQKENFFGLFVAINELCMEFFND